MQRVARVIIVISSFVFCSTANAQSLCFNADFEDSPAGAVTTSNQVSDWVCSGTLSAASSTSGLDNCNLLACCPNNPVGSMLISTTSGHIDPTIGSFYPIYSVFGASPADSNAAVVNSQINFPMKGKNFFRLGSPSSNPTRTERITKTFTVTSTNYLLDIAFIALLSRGHWCCDAAMFRVFIDNNQCSVIYSAASANNNCYVNKGMQFYLVQGAQIGGQVFNKWTIKSVDLSKYIGQTISLSFVAAGCKSNGHFGYAYIDTQCGTASVKANQNNFPLSIGTTSVSTCQNTATLTAPPYFENYQWINAQGITATTAVLITSVPATYTLNLSNMFSCNLTSYTIVVMPPPVLSISSSQEWSCMGTPIVLSANGLSSYTWSNGSNLKNITVSPTVATTYSLIGKDMFGCTATHQITQHVTDCVGLSDFSVSAKRINIYPNPNEKEFIVESAALTQGVLVIENLIGQEVYRQNILEGKNRINSKGLAAGVYYYKIFSAEKEIKRGKLKLE